MTCSCSRRIVQSLVFVAVMLMARLGAADGIPAAPPQPAIDPAEWEPNSGVLITYPLWIPMNLVVEMAEDAEVVTIVADETVRDQAQTAYLNAGVNLENCSWLIADPQTGWTRDYGPWQVFTGNDEQAIVDFIYAQGYPVDDAIPAIYGQAMGMQIYDLALRQSGTSNYMSDGMGVAMATDRTYSDNSNYTIEEIETLVHDYLGIDHYIVMQDWLNSSRHIDCWAKLIDPGRIMVRRVEPPHPILEADADYLSTLMSSYGRPYEVIRIDESTSTNYCNVLFLNHKVLVPQFNNPLDAQALATWQEAMPGYEVIGFSGSWNSGDAIHCRTHELTDRYMLRIVHVPLFDRENTGGGYPVDADIHPYSNEPMTQAPRIYWKTAEGSFAPVEMTHGEGDSYFADIPQQPDGTDIYYYIDAQDDAGKRAKHPYVGELGPHHFLAGPDVNPPELSVDAPSSIAVEEWPLLLTARVRDDRSISEVTLEYLVNGVPQDPIEMTLQPRSAVVYEATLPIPPGIEVGDEIRIRVVATDTAQSPNTATAPPDGYWIMDVEGPNRSCIWNACGWGSGALVFQMLERGGVSCHYTEEQPSTLAPYTNIYVFLGVYPMNHVLTNPEEQAILEAVANGQNVYIEGSDCWVYDPSASALCEAFNIIGVEDGENLVGPLLGVQGTFTEGMAFSYTGTNGWVDHIAPTGSGQLIIRNGGGIGYGVAATSGNARTVGLSFEFSGLEGNDGRSTREALLHQIRLYFARTPPPETLEERGRHQIGGVSRRP